MIVVGNDGPYENLRKREDDEGGVGRETHCLVEWRKILEA
jgi:hypothetical protein